ncbi:Exportin-6 [Lobosporangium transversale]|nr:Exportin-6 [Lobosporangium transversale]
MDVWKGLLDSMIHAASDIPRPIPPQDGLRRLQGPLFYFMSALVERFYQMKGATESEDAFSTFEVEDEEDLDDLTDLVESFVGLVAEIFTEEVIEMLIPLLTQQLELYSRREIDKCKTLPVTLGILSRVTYNFDRNFEDRRDYISNLVIHLVRMTNMSIDYYLATTGDTTGPAKGKEELTGTITLALFNCLSPLTSWLNQLWKVEMAPDSNDKTQTRTPIAREIYQEYAHLCASLFQRLLPTSSLGSLSQSAAPLSSSGPVNAFLGPATISCSTMDRKLLLTSVKTLEMLTLQVRIPSNLLSTGELLPWDLESVRGMGSCLSQNVMHCSSFMGLEFNTSSKDMLKGGGSDRADEEEEQDRKDITPDDELFMLAYLTLSNFITLDPKTGPELQSAALQAFGTLVAPIVYPLQSILQEARSSQGNHLSNPEVKFRVHRCLTILRTLIKSVNEASVASRTLVYEGLKSALPLIQEFFEAYIDDHELIRSLYRQIGMSQCMEIARVLMERSTNPSLLENALSSTPSQQHISPSGNPQQQALHQQSFVLHQRKIIQRIQLSVSILRIILELPGKEISQSLPSFIQFLFVQLGPKLFEAQQQGPQHPTGLGSNRVNQESSIDNGVYDLITVFFSTIQTLLTHHTRFFFASNGTNNLQASQTLQGCMEYLARGLHRQEPDIVRQSIEILCALQDHSLCHLFDRVEFQTAYRFEFLQILLRLALSHEHDLLLEDIAGLIHKLVKKGDRDPEDKFMTIWHVDLKRFVAALKPSQVKVMPVATSTFMSGSASPLSVPSLSVSPTPHSPHSPQTQTGGASRPFPDEVKEALWKDLMNLGDGSLYREALYEFVNDAQVYAQNLLVHP